MKQTKKILIISHVATRSGAPVLLLHLMRLLKEKGYSFNTIIAAGNGPLFQDFENISDICCRYTPPKQSALFNKLKRRITGKKKQFDIQPFLKDVDFVFSNTLANGHIVQLVREHYDGLIISYVHELQTVASSCTTDYFLKRGLELSDRILVPALAVKKFLEQSYNVHQKKIGMLNYYIPAFNFIDNKTLQTFKIKHALKASFIVGGLGNTEWRKGVDIFVQVAAKIFKTLPKANIQFIWMGGKKVSQEYEQMKFDIAKLELQNKIIVTENSAETILFFKSINLLLLTSREDPYPVVVLEAASENISTICFQESGGAPEFIQNDAGAVVPYLDTDAMTEAILLAYANNEILNKKNSKAKEKYLALHADKEKIYKQFINTLTPGN